MVRDKVGPVAAFKTAITSTVVRPIVACELDFSTGVLYFWNGYGDLSMTVRGASQTFTGLGDLAGISAVSETTEIKASGITLNLTGVKSSLISAALSANYTNRNAYVYLGLFDSSKNIVSDVYTLFSGKMDVLKINEQAETSSIELAVENRLIALEALKSFDINKNLAFKELFNLNNINHVLNINDLSFLIGPILNAGGRLGKSNYATELLSSENQEFINVKSLDLIDLNNKRKKIEAVTLENIDLKKIENENDDIIFYYNPKSSNYAGNC